VLVAVGQPPADGQVFSETRKLRNSFTHPSGRGKAPDVTIEDAKKVFDFCSSTIRKLFRHERKWRLVGTSGPRTLREKLRLAADQKR
jgi:hypothetical protein